MCSFHSIINSVILQIFSKKSSYKQSTPFYNTLLTSVIEFGTILQSAIKGPKFHFNLCDLKRLNSYTTEYVCYFRVSKGPEYASDVIIPSLLPIRKFRKLSCLRRLMRFVTSFVKILAFLAPVNQFLNLLMHNQVYLKVYLNSPENNTT